MLSANACVKSFETRRPWLLVPRSQCRSAVCTCHAAGSVCHQSPSRAHAPFASWHHAASCQAGETRYYGRRVELWGGALSSSSPRSQQMDVPTQGGRCTPGEDIPMDWSLSSRDSPDSTSTISTATTKTTTTLEVPEKKKTRE